MPLFQALAHQAPPLEPAEEEEAELATEEPPKLDIQLAEEPAEADDEEETDELESNAEANQFPELLDAVEALDDEPLNKADRNTSSAKTVWLDEAFDAELLLEPPQ